MLFNILCCDRYVTICRNTNVSISDVHCICNISTYVVPLCLSPKLDLLQLDGHPTRDMSLSLSLSLSLFSRFSPQKVGKGGPPKLSRGLSPSEEKKPQIRACVCLSVSRPKIEGTTKWALVCTTCVLVQW